MKIVVAAATLLVVSSFPTMVVAQLNEADCLSETAMFQADPTLTDARNTMVSDMESAVSSNFLSYCNVLQAECEVDMDDFSAGYEAACTGQIIDRDIDFSCTGELLPATVDFGLDDWPICVSTACDPNAIPAVLEQGIASAVNVAVDGLEDRLGGAIACELRGGSTATTAAPPEGTTTGMPGTTEEAATEPTSTTTGGLIPGVDDDTCVAETGALVADADVTAELGAMFANIEGNVTENFLDYCTVLDGTCNIDADDFSATFISTCEGAEGQIVKDDVDFSCTGEVSGIDIPSLTVGVDNWPICVGATCDGGALPAEVTQGIDDGVSQVISEIEAGLGGNIMCEMVDVPVAAETTSPSAAPMPTAETVAEEPSAAPVQEPSDAPVQEPTTAASTPSPTTSSAVATSAGAIVGALIPAGAVALLAIY